MKGNYRSFALPNPIALPGLSPAVLTGAHATAGERTLAIGVRVQRHVEGQVHAPLAASDTFNGDQTTRICQLYIEHFALERE